MAFIIYKTRHKGKLAVTIDRDRALKLERALANPSRIKDPKLRRYLANIKQLSIPAGPTILDIMPPVNAPFVPTGKDRAAGK